MILGFVYQEEEHGIDDLCNLFVYFCPVDSCLVLLCYRIERWWKEDEEMGDCMERENWGGYYSFCCCVCLLMTCVLSSV